MHRPRQEAKKKESHILLLNGFTGVGLCNGAVYVLFSLKNIFFSSFVRKSENEIL